MSAMFRMLVLAASLAALSAADAAAVEYVCRKKDSSLRIAIEVASPGHTLPCEVVVEDDRGERAVLYSAQYDRDYCPSRIEKTRAEVEQEGWVCDKTSDEAIASNHDTPANEDAGSNRRDVGEAQVVALQRSDEAAVPAAESGRNVVASLRCNKDGEIRHIQIEVEDPKRGTPCELLYWPDGDRTGPGELLWRAEHDAAFCPSRLSKIVAKWTGEGWQCDGDGLQTAALESAPDGSADAGPVPVAIPEARDPVEASPAIAQPTPATVESVAATDDEAADRPQQTAETAPTSPDVAISDEDIAEKDAAKGDVVAGQQAEAETDLSADPALAAVVAADAERVGEWMDVEPAIEIAARGDLNDDGTDDAVVVLAYQSEQAAYRQYLMSYLVAEGGYELAGVKLLTGVSPPPAQARVDQIDKGVIWVTLPREDGASAAHTGFKLHDQQLIEVDAGSNSPAGGN
ncbi:MAG: hypothetical protein R3F54_16145 [Alphaproteobacteria bacterium]